MKRSTQLLSLTFITTFLYVEIAEAKLLQSSGRGSRSGNFSQEFFYVDNQYVNEIGIIESAFEFDGPADDKSIVKAVGGGGRAINAVPNTCVNGYTQDQVDDLESARTSDIDFYNSDPSNGGLSDADFNAGIDAINNDYNQQISAITTGEPCVWEFDQGEDLFTFGFFSLFFGTPDVTYDVSWNIYGAGETWTLPGSVNTVPDLVTPDGTIEEGWVTLNAPAPSNLFAGDYLIDVSVSLSSTKGEFFWINGDPNDRVGFEANATCEINPEHDVWNIAYEAWLDAVDDWELNGSIGPAPVEPVEPEFETCGHPTFGTNSATTNLELRPSPTFFSSEQELLRILPVSSDPQAKPVNAPASLSMLLIGLGSLLVRRRKQRAS